jgi:hypothetical protein
MLVYRQLRASPSISCAVAALGTAGRMETLRDSASLATTGRGSGPSALARW